MPKEISPVVKERILTKLKDVNCTLISFEKGRKVKYICSCGNETETNNGSISRSTWGGCTKCANQRRGNTNTYEIARKVFEKGGIELPKQPYNGNKTKLFYTCPLCFEEAHMSLSEFKRGRLCEHCSKDRTKDTNISKYGVDNVFKSEVIKTQIKETCVKKYGVSHHMKLKSILNKAIKTNMKKYGIGFAFHSDESKIKSRTTCKEKYGKEYPLQVKEIQNKIKEKCREKLGVDYIMQSEYFRKTMLEKYGVEHALQNEDLFNKMIQSSFKTKLYTFPSGRIEYCQGYEPQCLNHLITLYEEDDIVVGSSSLPPIWYDNPEIGKQSRYYPDAYIISEHMVIEVKSPYTFKKDYEKNIAKFKRIVKMGFKMVLYICNKKEYIEKRTYTPEGVCVEPSNPVMLIFED